VAEKRSVDKIIQQWTTLRWRDEMPRTREHRFALYLALFTQIRKDGYDHSDIMTHHKKLIKNNTVNKKGPSAKREYWNDSADKHIEHAINKVWEDQIELAKSDQFMDSFSSGRKVPDTIQGAQGSVSQVGAMPSSKKLKEYVPDQKMLEFIDKNFKFEGTDEDLL
jgi:hypothetical protein